MRVLGIDLAAGAKKTYACVLDGSDGELRAQLSPSCDDEELRKLAAGCQKVAIDAPFGWPNAFIDAVNAHRVAQAWPAPEDGSPEVFRAALSFRATDRVVMHTRRPLSVSTDKIGVTAMRCAHLLHRWSATESVDRTGKGKFVEVYPAGALVRWSLEASGYKGTDKLPLGKLLSQVCEALPRLHFADGAADMCESVDDAFDALVAALVARAAALGLTDRPPPALHGQAAQEGWIHLPLRGSLPFLAHSKSGLRVEPASALAKPLRDIGVRLDEKGYARRIEDVLLPTFSAATIEAIARDLGGKGGSELVAKADGRSKFYAAHSSALLAANTFGPFLREHTGVPLKGKVFTGTTHLESECPTGLRGTPPTLDCLVDGAEVLAVESKCIETFSSHAARFADVYEDAMASMHKTWRAEYKRLIEDPRRYRYLDAAQLVKHYLGLRNRFPDRPVTLAYLYWAPADALALAPCAIHAAEVQEFDRHVADPKVEFIAMSSRELWDEWSSPKQPDWLREHAIALRRRYEVTI